MVEAQLDDRQKLLGFNEIFVGHAVISRPATTSRRRAGGRPSPRPA
jgi:hypothetical protein